MLGQILVEIDIEVDVGWTWRGVRHLLVDVFTLEWILIEQSVLGQILVDINIEVDANWTWRGIEHLMWQGMVEIVLYYYRGAWCCCFTLL